VAELGAVVDPFIMHLYAALVEKERAMISAPTKAALAPPRQGTRLGNPQIADAQVKGTATTKAAVVSHAAMASMGSGPQKGVHDLAGAEDGKKFEGDSSLAC